MSTTIGIARRALVAACLVSAAAIVLPAGARAEWPDRPIRAIVPFAPGGANDVMARLMSPQIAKALGVAVVVENKPGAAGNLGIEVVARSNPDGNTILFSATASTQNPALFKNMPFDPLKDIQPVAIMGDGPYVIVVNPKVQAKTPTDLVELARKNPGKLNAAAGGIGTRLSVELFNLKNNVKIEVVPYDGTGPASTAVVSGEADLAIMDTSSIVGQMSSGRLRALAVANEKRLSSFPDLPTTAELGMPDYMTGTLFGVYVAGGTPTAIVQRLNDVINKAIVDPEVAAQLRKLGAEPNPKTVAQFNERYRTEIATWKDIVAKAKIPQLD